VNRIRFINVVSYWDQPLSGWARINGRYFWFELPSQDATEAEEVPYTIYDAPDRSLKRYQLLRTRMFRHMVGWNYSYDPARHYTRRPVKAYTRPGQGLSYWDIDRMLGSDHAFKSSLKPVGISHDLVTVTWSE
jgi:hypothetical protein